MSVHLHFDASSFERIARLFNRLPFEIQKVAFGRAAARTRSVVERNYARFASAHIKVAQYHIKKRMTSRLSDAEIELRVKSTNIPLHEIGARQIRSGVSVRGRGRYEGNYFIPAASAKRAAGYVLRRDSDAKRTPARMMFGPSPADAIKNNPGDYERLLTDIAKNEFQKVILQQIAFLIR